jgi:uncharacterized protein
MTPASPSLASSLHDQYENVFDRPWPVLPSALVIAALNVFLFAFDRPWTASDGMRNWGDGLLQAAGIINQPDLLPPLLYSGSVLNLGLIFGALAAALLSREFAVRPAPSNELFKGALGGLLMGLGAMLSFGCNIGGFFSALSALSSSGVAMMAGLYLGAFAGARFAIRENARLIAAGQIPNLSTCEAPPRPAPESSSYRFQPVLGFLLLLVLAGAVLLYQQAGHARLGMFLLFGVAFGAVFQRSRFCLLQAFREPFMTGGSEHARAGALALTLSMIGFAILKASDLKDAGEWVFPSFWQGALFGGTLFGFGMVIAGGCGAGSLWRAGEGHIKLWIAVLFFALGASAMRQWLVRTDLIRQLGSAVFLPDEIGWAGASGSVVILMAIWYLLSGWNEQRKSAGLLKL